MTDWFAERMADALFADGYSEGFKDAETGRCLTNAALTEYATDWRLGYMAGQEASWHPAGRPA